MSTAVQSIEEGRIRLDFENLWNQIANMEWHEFKKACEYAYRAGRMAGKTDGLRMSVATDYSKQLQKEKA